MVLQVTCFRALNLASKAEFSTILLASQGRSIDRAFSGVFALYVLHSKIGTSAWILQEQLPFNTKKILVDTCEKYNESDERGTAVEESLLVKWKT